MKRLLTLLLILPLLAYCGPRKEEPTPDPNEQKDPENPDPQNPDPQNPDPQNPPVDASIDVKSADSFDIGFEGGTGIVRFIANVDWTITTEESWIHPSQESGTGSENTVAVIVRCDDNPSTRAREGQMLITAGTAQKAITFKQPTDPLATPAPPLVNGSRVSRLFTEKLDKGHAKGITDKEKRTLACWIDLGVPFCGDYEEGAAWDDTDRARWEACRRKRASFLTPSDK